MGFKAGDERVVNFGGEGEVDGAININHPVVQTPGWERCRGKGGLRGVKQSGSVVIAAGNRIPLASGSVDRVIAENIPVDKSTWLGPGYSSSEMKRVGRI